MSGAVQYAIATVPQRWKTVVAIVMIAAAGTALFVTSLTMRSVVDTAFAERNEQSDPPELVLTVVGDDGLVVDTAVAAGADQVLDFIPTSVTVDATAHLASVVFDEADWTVGRYTVIDGRSPVGATEAAVDLNLLGVLDAEVGDTITVSTVAGDQELRVVGSLVQTLSELAPFGPGMVIVDPAAKEAFGGPTGQWVLLSEVAADETFATLDELVAQGANAPLDVVVEVDDTAEIEESYRSTIDPMSIVLTSFGSLAATLLLLLIATLTAGQILGRRREFGVLRALGWAPGKLRALVAVETAAPALVGAVIGVPFGLLLARELAQEATAALGLAPAVPAPGLGTVIAVLIAPLAATIAGLIATSAGTRPEPARLLRAGRSLDSTNANRSRMLDRVASVPSLGLAMHYGSRPRGRTLLVGLSLILAASQVSTLIYYNDLVTTFETRSTVADRDYLIALGDSDELIEASIAATPAAIGSRPQNDPNDEDAPRHQVLRIVELQPGADASEVGRALHAASDGAVSRVETDIGDVATLQRIRDVTQPVTLVLLFAAIATLVVMVSHRVREQRRDLAVLGTTGVAARRRLTLVLLMALVPAAIAVAIGLPLGAPTLAFFMRISGGGDFTPLIATPSASIIAGAVIAMLGLALFAALPLGIAAARQRPAELLRHLD